MYTLSVVAPAIAPAAVAGTAIVDASLNVSHSSGATDPSLLHQVNISNAAKGTVI